MPPSNVAPEATEIALDVATAPELWGSVLVTPVGVTVTWEVTRVVAVVLAVVVLAVVVAEEAAAPVQ